MFLRSALYSHLRINSAAGMSLVHFLHVLQGGWAYLFPEVDNDVRGPGESLLLIGP